MLRSSICESLQSLSYVADALLGEADRGVITRKAERAGRGERAITRTFKLR